MALEHHVAVVIYRHADLTWSASITDEAADADAAGNDDEWSMATVC